MKPDTYTKVLLTIIAICLIVLAVDKLWMPAAHAQAGGNNVNLASIGSLPIVISTEGVICWEEQHKVTRPTLRPVVFVVTQK